MNHGDIVQLKSGGPKMTITRIIDGALSHESAADCAWFLKTGELNVGHFPLVALRKVRSR